MFTGIVEHVGRIDRIEPGTDRTRVAVAAGPVAEGVRIGDSIAVCGACLTITEIEGGTLVFDAVPETLERTKLGRLGVGDPVNLERAMQAGARFDGHVVQGHVDGVGAVRRFDRHREDVELHVECPPELADQLVDKGSVTLDGVSLTVVAVVPDGFHVALIPHTLEVTTLASLGEGDVLNVEVDVFGKYVRRAVARMLPGLVEADLAARREAGGGAGEEGSATTGSAEHDGNR